MLSIDNWGKEKMKHAIACLAVVMLMITSVAAVTGKQTQPTTPQPTRETDWWTMMRHDSGNTGSTTSSAPDTDQLKWQTNILEPITFTAPLVANNHLYLNTNSYLFLNPPHNRTLQPPTIDPLKILQPTQSYQGSIDCLDTKTGAMQWKRTFYQPNTPVYLDNKLYFTDFNINAYQGNLYCLNASTGADIFTHAVNGIGTSPTITANGKLYYATIDITSYGGDINCADTSGNTLWSYTLPAYQWSFSAPAVDTNNVYVLTFNVYSYYTGSLICLNANTGAYKWSHTVGNLFFYLQQSNLATCSDGKVYFTDFNLGSYNTYIRCFDGNTGSTLWSYPLVNSVALMPPSISDGSVFVSATDMTTYLNSLLRISATDGTLQWATPTPLSGALSGFTICSADKVYMTTGGLYYADSVSAFDKTTGQYLWNHFLSTEMYGTPAIASNILFLTDFNGGVYAYADQLTITSVHGGLLKASVVLTNTGNNTFTNVAWHLTVTGGLLGMISKDGNGTIPSITPGQRTTVSIGPLFGLGAIKFNATITPPGSVALTRHLNGTILGPLIILKHS